MRAARAVLRRDVWAFDVDARDRALDPRMLQAGLCDDAQRPRHPLAALRADRRAEARDAQRLQALHDAADARHVEIGPVQVDAAVAVHLDVHQARQHPLIGGHRRLGQVTDAADDTALDRDLDRDPSRRVAAG